MNAMASKRTKKVERRPEKNRTVTRTRKAGRARSSGRETRESNRAAHEEPPVEHASAVADNRPAFYDPADIEDALEFHALARAMGAMTRGTWESHERTVEERLQDFVFAYPPTQPTVHQAGRLRKQTNGSYAPGDADARLSRFLEYTWEPGTLHELLSRFGLRMKTRPEFRRSSVALDPLRDVAKRRNVRLRVLHGGVDIEPANMDAAKADYLDRQEKQQAAKDVRAARERMRRELEDNS